MLEINKEYTVVKTIRFEWNTVVYLEEFPNDTFNSANFEDVTNYL